ncbi:MAG: transcriptional regulator PpsR [Acetobacteraceae bacterium]|nr:transcriptional regulator PpsR [Acetobacteraceae bacterium]
MKPFTTPSTSLGILGAGAAAALIAAASDLALVLDEGGVIQDVAFQNDELGRDLGAPSWIGRPWTATVSAESRSKIEAILRDATAEGTIRWRHINHPGARDSQIPVLFGAARMEGAGKLVAFGRDMRAMSDLQQRLVNAQQSLEQDYSRMRHVEIRYQLLFQMSSEAVLVADATTLRVTEANPAAHRFFGDGIKRLLGRGLPHAFDPAGAEAVGAMAATVRVSGRADDVRVRLSEGGRHALLSASLFREDNVSLLLVRVSPAPGHDADALTDTRSTLLTAVENAPDGFVVIDAASRIITANAAFLELAGLASEEAARGESLDRWLGREGVDLDVLLVNLRQRGSVRLFSTIVRGEFGATTEVEVSAASLTHEGEPRYGLAIRNVGRRLSPEPASERPGSVEHLTELIGRVSLKELVRQSTDMIERLCIETALKMTGDNRASAAEMLGLSRQSLYVKLRRYGLGDLAQEAGDLA